MISVSCTEHNRYLWGQLLQVLQSMELSQTPSRSETAGFREGSGPDPAVV